MLSEATVLRELTEIVYHDGFERRDIRKYRIGIDARYESSKLDPQ
jgi:hypothetical protein